MKLKYSIVFVICSLPGLMAAQIGTYQHGSVVRMHMGDCTLAQHGFKVAFGGPSIPMSQDACPEYTLVSSEIVFVIVAKSSNQLIPLAETIGFRLYKNELLVRVDDAKREVKFTVKEMVVRTEWDRLQRLMEEHMRAAVDREAER